VITTDGLSIEDVVALAIAAHQRAGGA